MVQLVKIQDQTPIYEQMQVNSAVQVPTLH